ncbi:MAG: response regulator transcription factor [Flavobacteriaceae bacterium]|nr:response regulator transcription factor [Flavobacteriaceae bacterium]
MEEKFFSFQNSVTHLSEEDISKTANYLAPIEAFARITYSSIYVIDYEKKGFEFVSHNPLFLCGHTPKEVAEMGYSFYFKYVTEEDLDLLLKINKVGFDFYDKLPMEERLLYTISYDFHLKNKEGKTILVNQKLTPIYLNSEGKIWKAICIVSLSTEQKSGNIKIYKQGNNEKFSYDLEGDFWKKEEKINLSTREKEILTYSARGFTISQIAETIFVSENTVKFHRKKMFEKLGVSNISEAIFFATNNKLI